MDESITARFRQHAPFFWWVRANWKGIAASAFALLGTAGGYAIGIGMSRQERTDDQQSRERLEKNLKELTASVDELGKHTAKIEDHLTYEDQRLTRMEDNWDEARQIAGTPPRRRK